MTRPRILVVDDEQAMLHATRRVLSDQYEIASAESAAQALEALPTFKPELAILDIRMPEMDGFELMARLKVLRPDLDLIVMTGSASEADAKLIRAIREKAFYFIQKPFDREVLLTLVARCFELRRMTEANRRHVGRLEGELEEARTFQKSLLPAQEASVGGVAIRARYVPCSELGGDFFDYAPAGEGRTAVLVADVSGHGAAAAMLTGIVKAAFHSAVVEDYEPEAVILRIAAGIRTLADHMMVTAICARLSGKSRSFEYAGAGHPPGILWTPATPADAAKGPQLHLLVPTGPLISPAFPTASWQKRVLPLEGPARLLLYSDGIIEAQGEDGEFGLTRLLDLIRACPERPRRDGGDKHLPDHILATLRTFVGGRPMSDDMTLLEARLAD